MHVGWLDGTVANRRDRAEVWMQCLSCEQPTQPVRYSIQHSVLHIIHAVMPSYKLFLCYSAAHTHHVFESGALKKLHKHKQAGYNKSKCIAQYSTHTIQT